VDQIEELGGTKVAQVSFQRHLGLSFEELYSQALGTRQDRTNFQHGTGNISANYTPSLGISQLPY
jgi:hypothetical protein